VGEEASAFPAFPAGIGGGVSTEGEGCLENLLAGLSPSATVSSEGQRDPVAHPYAEGTHEGP
jgi:hypothetical protein